jgi:hypothetical protein
MRETMRKPQQKDKKKIELKLKWGAAARAEMRYLTL